MLVDASFAIWGGALVTLLTLIVTVFSIKGVKHIRQVFQVQHQYAVDGLNPAEAIQDAEHRALMFIMNQKTDSLLAALASTIEQERQKLGTVVRKPSMPQEAGGGGEKETNHTDRAPAIYERVLPLVQKGVPIADIARQLDLSESEVSLVMRLEAA